MREGGEQVVLVNKSNRSTSPEVVATRMQNKRHMKVLWCVGTVVAPRKSAKKLNLNWVCGLALHVAYVICRQRGCLGRIS